MSASTPRRVAVWAALGLAAIGAWRWLPASAPADDDPSLIVDRAWVDSSPQKYTDYVHAFFASKYSQTSVFQKASSYDFHFELATYRREGKKLVLAFPQTGKSAEITFSIRACNDMPPFDLCLELSANPWGGPRRYHGMKEQEDDSALRKTAKTLRVEAGE